jgi:hypothetical protein
LRSFVLAVCNFDCRFFDDPFARITVMKGVGGDGDDHQMHKNHHPHHHHYHHHHHHQIPQDFSLEYSLSGTSSPEAVLSAVVDGEEEEVAQEHRRSLRYDDSKAQRQQICCVVFPIPKPQREEGRNPTKWLVVEPGISDWGEEDWP